MTTINLTVQLPEQVAREARMAGLLSSESIALLITDAVRRQRITELFDAADRLAAVEMPALSIGEVEAEIESARREKAMSI